MLRVGMILSLRGSWLGGINYFQNLLSCYRQYPDPEVTLALFSAHPEDLDQYRSEAIEVFAWPEMPQFHFSTVPRRVARRLLKYDPAQMSCLIDHGVDLLSHNSIGKQKAINTLCWQPDFQHMALKHLFSKEDCKHRDTYIRRTRMWGHILLSSQAAADDFREFFPELASVQTHILHFPGVAILKVEPLSREELSKHYPITEPYFYLPNHFWKHKNHGVVVEALRMTRREIRVICTGSTDDWRDPTYYPGLMERVAGGGLSGRFISLGPVPYPIVASLMHHAIGVLQPSLFEGWSTTVEEAKAMQKLIILSNIKVHREQAPERGAYFAPGSAEELADCMDRAYSALNPSNEETCAKQRLAQKGSAERCWMDEYVCILKSVARRD